MSEMTKMLHYQTSSGATGACKIYTTEEECPSPNLKVQIDATTGYVKLSEEENNPDATPIRVHVNSSGKTLKVLKAATAPTGEKLISTSATFTVPSGITVLEIEYDTEVSGNEYVGVTPGSTHKITIESDGGTDSSLYYVDVYCATHREYWGSFEWEDEPYLGVPNDSVIIRWSPEINKKSPTRTDY